MALTVPLRPAGPWQSGGCLCPPPASPPDFSSSGVTCVFFHPCGQHDVYSPQHKVVYLFMNGPIFGLCFSLPTSAIRHSSRASLTVPALSSGPSHSLKPTGQAGSRQQWGTWGQRTPGLGPADSIGCMKSICLGNRNNGGPSREAQIPEGAIYRLEEEEVAASLEWNSKLPVAPEGRGSTGRQRTLQVSKRASLQGPMLTRCAGWPAPGTWKLPRIVGEG